MMVLPDAEYFYGLTEGDGTIEGAVVLVRGGGDDGGVGEEGEEEQGAHVGRDFPVGLAGAGWGGKREVAVTGTVTRGPRR